MDQAPDHERDVLGEAEARAHRLLTAWNIAENGRAFCGLICIVNALSAHFFLAALAVIPLGLSILVDGPLRYHRFREQVEMALFVFATVLLVVSLVAAAG